MFHRILLPFLFCALLASGFSQESNKFIRPEIDNLPQELIKDPSTIRTNILDFLPEKFKTGENERLTLIFADNVAHEVSGDLTSGKIYTNWPEMETYMMNVMKKVIPEELINNQLLHTYLFKDGNFNASMDGTGVLRINVGVWTYLESEAELASLIAHEVAHYYCHHSVDKYIKATTGKYKYNRIGNPYKLEWKDSQQKELEADSLAYIWVRNSPYSLDGSSELLYLLERLEKLYMKRTKYNWELKPTSHPLSEERIALLQRIKMENQGSGERFIQPVELFESLKKQAIVEALEVKLRNFEYRDGIEMAFKYHILDPDNKVYVYYLMEHIRRQCYRSSEEWTKNFIIDGYYEEQAISEKDEDEEKKALTGHLFEKFDPHVMSMAPSELRKIQGRFYWEGELKFITNEQAFNFFYQLGQVLGCDECHLSEALSQVSDQGARDKALQAYLNTSAPMYPEYARAILNGTALDGLSKNKVTAFNSFLAYVNQGQDPIPVNIQSEFGDTELNTFLDSTMSTVENRKFIYLNSLQKGALKEYMLLHELKYLSRQTFISQGVKPELHIIDPRYMHLFQKYNVDEIEFVECRYIEYKKSEKTISAYDEMMGMNYSHIFSGNKSTRFLEVYISSVRSVKKGRMKYQYYSDQLKFKFNEASRDQIRFHIRGQFPTKDDRMVKDHYYYNQLD